MDIILNGKYSTQKTADNLKNILILFKNRYHIKAFREIRLSVTLVNSDGDDVELIDTDTEQVYRVLEIHQQNNVLPKHKRHIPSALHLAIDNTTKSG